MERLHRIGTSSFVFFMGLVILLSAWGAFGGSPTRPQIYAGQHLYKPTVPTLAGTPRGPITILSDADFTGANGVTGGTGTVNDPFIISGWEIDAGGAFYCIEVGGTTKYFTIQDCVLTNVKSAGIWDGITLNGLDYATIRNCSISNCYRSIELINVQATNVTITHNSITVSQSAWGILLLTCQNVSITANTITGSGTGIYLDHTSNTLVEENNCSMDEALAVISGFYSQNTTIRWNNCSITTTTSQRDGLISILSLESSDYAEIAENTLGDGDVGISLANCSNAKVNNNLCGLKYWGINLESCVGCEVTGNAVTRYTGIMYTNTACLRDVGGVNNVITPNTCTEVPGPLDAWIYLFLGACVVCPAATVYIIKRKKVAPSGTFDGPWKRACLVAAAELAVVCIAPLSVNFPISSGGPVNGGALGLFYQSFYPGINIEEFSSNILGVLVALIFSLFLVATWMTLHEVQKVTRSLQNNVSPREAIRDLIISAKISSVLPIFICGLISILSVILIPYYYPFMGVGFPLFFLIFWPLLALRYQFVIVPLKKFEISKKETPKSNDIRN